MLSRRIIRVKAVQVLFSSEIGKDISPVKIEKALLESIKSAENLYHIYLLYLIEITNYSLVYDAKQKTKLSDNVDLNSSIALSNNTLIKLIENNQEFKDYVLFQDLNKYINKKIVKSLFEILIKKEKYSNYIGLKEKTKVQELDIIRYLIKKIVGSSLDLEEDLADYFINIEEDSYYALLSIQKTLKCYENDKESLFLHKILLLEDNSEIRIFGSDLVDKYFEYEDETKAIIKPNLKNWDFERIAVIDIVMLKMAICELKYFSNIPVKVTINEYLEISKEYSSDKSKVFINGILDKIMKMLKEKGEIRKQGRGLIN